MKFFMITYVNCLTPNEEAKATSRAKEVAQLTIDVATERKLPKNLIQAAEAQAIACTVALFGYGK